MIYIIAGWTLIGVLTVPWIIGECNRRGDSMERNPAMEAFVGACFGPFPIVMFACYFVLRTIGRIAYRITGQGGAR